MPIPNREDLSLIKSHEPFSNAKLTFSVSLMIPKSILLATIHPSFLSASIIYSPYWGRGVFFKFYLQIENKRKGEKRKRL